MTGKGITNPWHKLYVLQPLTSFDPAAFLVENCSADITFFLDFFHTLCNNNPVIACQMSCKISLCHFIALHWTDLSKSAINLKGVGCGSYHIPVLSAPQLWKAHESTWKDLWLSWNLNSALEFLPYKDIRPLFKSAVFQSKYLVLIGTKWTGKFSIFICWEESWKISFYPVRRNIS